MARTNRAGIATFVMRGKEYLVAITSDNGILRAETMRFHDEVRSPEDLGLPKKDKPAPATVRSIEKLLNERSRPSLGESQLKDKASERLMKLIERKRKKEENIVGAPAGGARKAEVVDLLEVLRQSLSHSGKSERRRASR
jgi:DNA end-binding protein Ku